MRQLEIQEAMLNAYPERINNPILSKFYYHLALAYERHRHWDKAYELYTEAAEINPISTAIEDRLQHAYYCGPGSKISTIELHKMLKGKPNTEAYNALRAYATVQDAESKQGEERAKTFLEGAHFALRAAEAKNPFYLADLALDKAQDYFYQRIIAQVSRELKGNAEELVGRKLNDILKALKDPIQLDRLVVALNTNIQDPVGQWRKAMEDNQVNATKSTIKERFAQAVQKELMGLWRDGESINNGRLNSITNTWLAGTNGTAAIYAAGAVAALLPGVTGVAVNAFLHGGRELYLGNNIRILNDAYKDFFRHFARDDIEAKERAQIIAAKLADQYAYQLEQIGADDLGGLANFAAANMFAGAVKNGNIVAKAKDLDLGGTLQLIWGRLMDAAGHADPNTNKALNISTIEPLMLAGAAAPTQMDVQIINTKNRSQWTKHGFFACPGIVAVENGKLSFHNGAIKGEDKIDYGYRFAREGEQLTDALPFPANAAEYRKLHASNVLHDPHPPASAPSATPTQAQHKQAARSNKILNFVLIAVPVVLVVMAATVALPAVWAGVGVAVGVLALSIATHKIYTQAKDEEVPQSGPEKTARLLHLRSDQVPAPQIEEAKGVRPGKHVEQIDKPHERGIIR